MALHKWTAKKRIDGTVDPYVFDCVCGWERRPAIFKDDYYRRPDGSAFTQWRTQPEPPCPGAPESKKEETR